MSAEDIEFLYFQRAEGDLSPEEEAAFDARVSEDEDFRKGWRSYQLMLKGLRSIPQARPPEDLVADVRREIEVVYPIRPRWFYDVTVSRGVELAALTMLLLMAAVWTITSIPKDHSLSDAQSPPPHLIVRG